MEATLWKQQTGSKMKQFYENMNGKAFKGYFVPSFERLCLLARLFLSKYRKFGNMNDKAFKEIWKHE
jgi:hypothetical protein